jgi:hypothetical protein
MNGRSAFGVTDDHRKKAEILLDDGSQLKPHRARKSSGIPIFELVRDELPGAAGRKAASCGERSHRDAFNGLRRVGRAHG